MAPYFHSNTTIISLVAKTRYHNALRVHFYFEEEGPPCFPEMSSRVILSFGGIYKLNNIKGVRISSLGIVVIIP